jgi:hypothetical protein
MADTDRRTSQSVPEPGLSESTAGYWDHYIHLYDERPEGYEGSCLRPLGRCELGGACQLCLHNPDNRKTSE